MVKRILVTGSRNWVHPELVERVIWDTIRGRYPVTIVHGGAAGADSYASRLCRLYKHHPDLQEEVHLPDYQKYGRRAPHVRNDLMISLGADACLAFIRDESNGASSTAQKAYEAGIATHEFHYDTDTDYLVAYFRNKEEGIDGRSNT